MNAEAGSWKREPLGDAQPIPYAASFSPAEYDRIKVGLIPQAMEDKWFIYFEEPSLHLHRSWTGQGVYRVDFAVDRDGARTERAVCSTSVLMRQGPEYQAQLLNFLIGNFLLGRSEPFPRPPGLAEAVPGIMQHAISGTGFPEKPMKHLRPWWKFWA